MGDNESGAVAQDIVSESGEDIETNSCKKRRGETRVWTPLRTFASTDDACGFIIAEKSWKVHRTYYTYEGNKTEYRCNVNGMKNPCPCKLLLFQPSDTTDAQISTYDTHVHLESAKSLSKPLLDKIISLGGNRMKPKSIQAQLRSECVEYVPSLKQIGNAVYRNKCTRYETSKVSLGALNTWLFEKSVVPENDNEPFILKFETSAPLDNDLYFRFAVTSKYLLSIALKSKILHADATYKMNWQGFPVFTIGCTDMQRRFHPFFFGIATSEKHQDYVFMFESLKSGMATHFNFIYEPKVLVADAAPAISNAFESVFNTNSKAVIVMCYTHVMTNIQKQSFSSTILKEQVISDIRALHAAPHPLIYKKAQNLFVLKYENEQPVFCNYMENIWLSKNWYVGVRHFTPCTNNAVEGTHAVLKRDHTIRERQKVEIFKHTMCEIVGTMSERNSREKPYVEEVLITNQDWEKAVNWISLGKHQVEVIAENMKPKYYVQSSKSNENKKKFEKAVQTYKTRSWKNFERYTIIPIYICCIDTSSCLERFLLFYFSVSVQLQTKYIRSLHGNTQ